MLPFEPQQLATLNVAIGPAGAAGRTLARVQQCACTAVSVTKNLQPLERTTVSSTPTTLLLHMTCNAVRHNGCQRVVQSAAGSFGGKATGLMHKNSPIYRTSR